MTGERCTALLWNQHQCRLDADHDPGHLWDIREAAAEDGGEGEE